MQNFSSLGPVVFEIQPVLCSFFTTFLLVGVRKRPQLQGPLSYPLKTKPMLLPDKFGMVIEVVSDSIGGLVVLAINGNKQTDDGRTHSRDSYI